MASNVEIFLQAHKQTQESVNKIFEPYFKMKQLQMEYALQSQKLDQYLEKQAALELFKSNLNRESDFFRESLRAQNEAKRKQAEAKIKIIEKAIKENPELLRQGIAAIEEIQAGLTSGEETGGTAGVFGSVAPGATEPTTTAPPATTQPATTQPATTQAETKTPLDQLIDEINRLNKEAEQKDLEEIERYATQIRNLGNMHGLSQSHIETFVGTLPMIPPKQRPYYATQVFQIIENSSPVKKEREAIMEREKKAFEFNLSKAYERLNKVVEQAEQEAALSSNANTIFIQEALLMPDQEISQGLAQVNSEFYQNVSRIMTALLGKSLDQDPKLLSNAAAVRAIISKGLARLSPLLRPMTQQDVELVEGIAGANFLAPALTKLRAYSFIAEDNANKAQLDYLKQNSIKAFQTPEQIDYMLQTADEVRKIEYLYSLAEIPLSDSEGRTNTDKVTKMRKFMIRKFIESNPSFWRKLMSWGKGKGATDARWLNLIQYIEP